MKSKVEIALEDVIMIKKVIEKTQQDFSGCGTTQTESVRALYPH